MTIDTCVLVGEASRAAVRPVSADLFDTCVIIDYLRHRLEAVEFRRRQAAPPAISAITAAELFAGARNSAEERQIEALCGRFLTHRVDPEIARPGGSYCRQYRHSHASSWQTP